MSFKFLLTLKFRNFKTFNFRILNGNHLNLSAMKRRNILTRNLLFILLCCLTGVLGIQPALAQVDGEVSLDFPAEDKLLEVAHETVKAYEMGNWEALRKNATKDARFYNLGSYDSLNLDQTIEYWNEGRKIASPVLSEDGVWLAVAVPKAPGKEIGSYTGDQIP